MKQHLLPATRLTIVCLLIFMVAYPLLIWGIAQASPNNGDGEIITLHGKAIGYKLLGQRFTDDKYFNGRPSAVDYNAAGSGGSNKGPSNPEYLKMVEDRTDTFLAHNPTITKAHVPAELVTASGSGLDPDISPEAALVQVKRIAVVRKMSEEQVKNLVSVYAQKSLIAPAKVNVLQLNIALDKTANQ